MVDPERGFSLIHEPWIQVLVDGASEEVSLLELFRRSQEIQEIVGDIPTQAFALTRLTLAMLHRAVEGPRDKRHWRELWNGDGPPMDLIEAYLTRYEDRFDLFHPATPFFQVADLHTAKDEHSGLEKLVADVPAGHPYFTTRIGRGMDRLTPAEAARWLVHLQAYDISGIKSGAVGDDRVKGGKGYPIGTGWAGAIGGITLEYANEGASLWRTLLLNLIPADNPTMAAFSERDRPSWEATPSTAAQSDDIGARPFGPLDLYTWQSRRVRLIGDQDGVTAVVVSNGDKITPQNHSRQEPMTAWRRSPAQEKARKEPLVYMPRQHDPARALWRGLGQLLPAAAPRGKIDEGESAISPGVLAWANEALRGTGSVRIHAVGMVYGTQNAIVEDLYDDRLTISTAMLSERDSDLPQTAIDAAVASELAVVALRNLAANLVRAAGAREDALVNGSRDRAAERAYAALDAPFRDWLAALEPGVDLDEARIEWHRIAARIVRRIGADLVAAAGPDAWVGREINGRRVTSPEADGWFQSAVSVALPTPSRASLDASSTKEVTA